MSSIGSVSGSITFSGLGSETDTKAIVDKLVEFERYNIYRMESWKGEWQAKITAIEGLNNRVYSLYETCKSFNEDFEFYARQTSSSDTSILSVTNTPYAKPGAHTMEVASATQHRFASRGVASAGTVFGGSAGEELVIMVGSTAITLSYGNDSAAGQWHVNDTLSQLASAIRAKDALGSNLLLVSIIDDGSWGNPARMVLTSRNAGTDYRISVADDPTNLGLDGTWTVDSEIETYSGWITSAAINVADLDGYQGHTNKRFTFNIVAGGPVSGADITIAWTDTEGNGGAFHVSAVGSYAVFQGVKLDIGSGTLVTGDKFFLDVYSNDLQAAQDNGLAQAHQLTHTGFVDKNTTTINTSNGFFSYTYAGNNYTVGLAAGKTLTDLVWAINNDSNNPGVTASIFDDGLGLATSVHLRLTGDKPGAANQITDINFTDLDKLSNTFSTTQKAQNAMVKVDGYPAGGTEYIQRSTNQISDLIQGVTLKLKSPGEVTISTENDISTIAEKIETFVNAVNFVLEYINEQTKYDEETEEVGIMLGNYAFNLVESRLKSLITSPLNDLDEETDAYVMLAQIGIETDPDNGGLFSLDMTKLDTALSIDLDAVANLFIRNTERYIEEQDGVAAHYASGVAELMAKATYDLTDGISGPMNVLISNYEGIIDGIDDKIAREERRVALVQSRLEDRFARLEATMALLEGQQQSLEDQIASLPSLNKNK